MIAASSPDSPQAAVIGKYRPILELGRGGMANVYLCVVRGIGGFSKLQVVKRLRPEFAEEPDFRSMFLEEARLAARINHPNVVQTNEVGMDGSNLFIAMEYLEGQSLEELIRRSAKVGKPLALKFYLPILVDALRGLHFAHELKDFQGRPLKVIHRDVSPHNILITYDGQVKVVDFGIAKAADSSHETRTGVLKGKVAYMAPEQIAAKERLDRRADVFAVGAILWRALVGKRLWRGLNDMEILVKITHGEIPSPATEKPDLDPKLVAICTKALEPDPDKRYSTAQEMVEALEGYIAAAPERATQREIGELVSELFADRRKEITDAIEKGVGSAADGSAGWSSLDLPGAPASRSTLTPSHISGSLPGVTSEHATQPAGAFSTPELPLGVERNRRRIAVGAALLGLLSAGVIIGALFFHRSSTDTHTSAPSATPTGTTAPTEPASAATPALEQVQLQIKLSPPDATITIDDKPLTPSSRYFKDGAVHRVRVSAKHHETETRLVTFDSSTVSLDFTLHKETVYGGHPILGNKKQQHEAPTASVVAPPPPPPPVVTANPPPPPTSNPTSNKLVIDPSNPWK